MMDKDSHSCVPATKNLSFLKTHDVRSFQPAQWRQSLFTARTLVFEELTSIIGAKGSTAGISIPKSEAVVLSAAEIMEALK